MTHPLVSLDSSPRGAMMVTDTDLSVADHSRSAQGRVHFINAFSQTAGKPFSGLSPRINQEVTACFPFVQLATDLPPARATQEW